MRGERGKRRAAYDVGAMKAPHVSVMLRGWDIRTGTTGGMVLDAARRGGGARHRRAGGGATM
jgi:hypothetical protein